MEVRPTKREDSPALFALWRDAFPGEDGFWHDFLTGVFEDDRAIALFEDGKLSSALYFFDCRYDGRTFAYIFAVATDAAKRRRGYCGLLLKKSHAILASRGYSGALLCPQNDKLFDFYRKIGYNTVLSNDRFEVDAADFFKEDLSDISTEDFLAHRSALKAEGTAEISSDAVRLFSAYGRFAKCSDALFAYHFEGDRLICDQLLGNRRRAAELPAFLGVPRGTFKTVGSSCPYCLALSFDGSRLPSHFGLELM